MRPHLSTRFSAGRLTLLAALGLGPALCAQNRQIELEWLRNAGRTYEGVAPGESTGSRVVIAGRINDDAFDDVLLAAPFASPGGAMMAGKAWIVYGGADQTGSVSLANADVTLLGNPNTPFIGGKAGHSIAAAGDVNGDGFDDVLIGAPNESPNGSSSGQVYLVYGGPALPASLTLVELGGLGVTINGIDNSDTAGSSVAGLGDVNGDTYDDIAIGARGAHNGALSFAGESYIVYGGPALPSVLQLSGLTTGTGVRIKGVAQSDESGTTIAGPGDVNGDSWADLLVGAPKANPGGKTDAGSVYLVYGGSALPDVIGLSTLGSAGVVFNGQFLGHGLGAAIAGAGDMNGDGKDDLLLSAPTASPGGVEDSGLAYLVFGSDGLPGSVEMSALGALGVSFAGTSTNLKLGNALGGGADLNRDGLDDFLIAAEQGDPNGDSGAGEVYLLFGAPSGWPASLALTQIDARGVVLAGIDSGDHAGNAVSVGGDVNADGTADLLVGMPGDPSDSGRIALVYGACHFLQAVGPVAEGGALNLRAHGAAGAPMEMMFSPFLLPSAPVATALGLFWLGAPFFELPLGNFGGNGEFQISFPLPPVGSGLVGLTLHVQFLGQPQGLHCDLTYLLSVTFE